MHDAQAEPITSQLATMTTAISGILHPGISLETWNLIAKHDLFINNKRFVMVNLAWISLGRYSMMTVYFQTGKLEIRLRVIWTFLIHILNCCSAWVRNITDHPAVGALMSSDTPKDMDPMKSFRVVRSQSHTSMDRRRSLSNAFSLLSAYKQGGRRLHDCVILEIHHILVKVW